MSEASSLTLRLHRFDDHGTTRAGYRGRWVEVEHGIPGETVVVELTGSQRRRARIVEVLESAPDRVEPPCEYFRDWACGGCQWQHISYEGQLARKREQVDAAMQASGLDLVVGKVHALDDPWRYRSTAGIALGRSAGFRRHGSLAIVPIRDCPISHPLIGRLMAQLNDMDAFVLPGAPADVNPSLYRAARHPKTHDADGNREKTDFAILEHAFAAGKPVLAICYGCQSLNVCLGGTLYQDIASELRTNIEHSKEGLPPDAPDPLHAARIEPGGELGQFAAASGLQKRDGGFDAQVNTSHHQSIRDLGHALRLAAVAPDGVIEAVEHEPHKHWVVGVQWHPERMAGHALSQSLFRALVRATRAAAAHRT